MTVIEWCGVKALWPENHCKSWALLKGEIQKAWGEAWEILPGCVTLPNHLATSISRGYMLQHQLYVNIKMLLSKTYFKHAVNCRTGSIILSPYFTVCLLFLKKLLNTISELIPMANPFYKCSNKGQIVSFFWIPAHHHLSLPHKEWCY